MLNRAICGIFLQALCPMYTIAAKGCFVAAKNVELLRETNLKKIEEYMEQIARLAVSCNLTKQEVIEMLNYIMEE